MELSARQAIFVGFKLDGSLRRQLDSLEGPDRRYVSDSENTFLTICTVDGNRYVGKVVEERLTTDRVEDVKRNVLSIMQRLCPETRMPRELEIWVVAVDRSGVPAPDGEPARMEEKPPRSGGFS